VVLDINAHWSITAIAMIKVYMHLFMFFAAELPGLRLRGLRPDRRPSFSG
jgi:hypothetical protein